MKFGITGDDTELHDEVAGHIAKFGVAGDDAPSRDDVWGHGQGHPVVVDADDTDGHSIRVF